MRRFVCDVAKNAGYTVIDAAAADEGEQLLSSYPGRVDLVISDVNLAGTSGRQFGARLRHRLPDLRMLFISGGDDDDNLAGEAYTAFLQKPFSPSVRQRLWTSTPSLA